MPPANRFSRSSAKRGSGTKACSNSLTDLPTGEIPISTGVARLEVDRSGVTLFVNGVPSSYLDFQEPGFLGFEYFQVMTAILDSQGTAPIRALHLGAGGCALARAWDYERPGSRQICVEIDGELVTLVRKWFDLPRAPALRLRHQDAWEAVESAHSASFDVVVRDLFVGDTTPSQFSSAAFTEQVARILKPSGLYLANVADRPPLTATKRELHTLNGCFAHTCAIAEVSVIAGKRFGNVVLAASNAPQDPFGNPALARTLRSLPLPARFLSVQDGPISARIR